MCAILPLSLVSWLVLPALPASSLQARAGSGAHLGSVLSGPAIGLSDAMPATGPDPGSAAGPDPGSAAGPDPGSAAAPEASPPKQQPPASPEEDSAAAPPDSSAYTLFPPRMEMLGGVYLPTAHYSKENGLGLGLQVLYPFDLPWVTRSLPPSTLKLKGRITSKGRGLAEAEANLVGDEDTWELKFKVEYSSLAERFWGLGPDTPSGDEEVYYPQDVRAYAEGMQELAWNLKVGLRYEYAEYLYLKTKPGGLLDTRGYRGTDRGKACGAGLVLDWDTRNCRYCPESGLYYQAFALFFDEELGSDFDFNNYHVDLRHYYAVAPNHVLAAQFFLYEVRGLAPIWRYAALGGRHHTRGYREARYLDRTLCAFQGEYRFPIWSRLSAAAFAGLANVAPTLDDLELEHMRPTLGGGVRVRLSSTNKVRARLDAAAGENSLRFYLALGEAF